MTDFKRYVSSSYINNLLKKKNIYVRHDLNMKFYLH
jgi:hypothetical protein